MPQRKKSETLIIVESPTKAKTISRFLGSGFVIESSYGHIRDLPKSKLGIDTEHGFEPSYIVPLRARKNVTALRKLAGAVARIILATDEDREGEAIAWHLRTVLDPAFTTTKAAPKKVAHPLPPVERIVFHEITEHAIRDALEHPRAINQNLVNAQQARRVLDRLVGYLLSPFLWKKVVRGLSAGRVQSVALRLVVEREDEIKRFKPDEYWTIAALLSKRGDAASVQTLLHAKNGESIPKLGIPNKKEADAIIHDLGGAVYTVNAVERREMRRNPLPPFTTSTMQQEANRRLRMSARRTMTLAQHLYEKGFITYMRTDSVNLSSESLGVARTFIERTFGARYLIPVPRSFVTKSRLAQEAHEAIRPTNPLLQPEELSVEDAGERKLYDLIWRRFVASQLPQAVIATTKIDVEGESKKSGSMYTLSANGSSLAFDGFLRVWPSKFEERLLPQLEKGDALDLEKLDPEQHFTEPPARYNEASLIKALEAFGIGRPSTYAPTLSVVQERNYVQKNQDRRFEPTEIGTLVNKVLTEHFPEVVDIQFTARMEAELDEIAGGAKQWRDVIREFYGPFSKHLEQKYEEVKKDEFVKDEQTDQACEKCGRPMVIRTGRFGKFLACSGFPECKNTKSLTTTTGGDRASFGSCPKCTEEKREPTGEVVMKRTKRGRFFYGCNRYPDCDYATWTRPKTEEEKEEES